MKSFLYSISAKRPNRLLMKGDKGDKGDPPWPAPAPKGKCRVTGLYVDPDDGQLYIQYDDIPVT